MERRTDLVGENRGSWSLPRVAARQAEDFFQQVRIPFPAALADPEIMLDDPSDDGVVELVSHLRPWPVRPLLGNGITTSSRVVAHRGVTDFPVLESVRLKFPPPLDV